MWIDELMSDSEIADNVTHRLLSRLLNWFIGGVLSFVAFAISAAFYAGQLSKDLETIKDTMGAMQERLDQNILPEARIRIDALEDWKKEHSAKHQ